MPEGAIIQPKIVIPICLRVEIIALQKPSQKLLGRAVKAFLCLVAIHKCLDIALETELDPLAPAKPAQLEARYSAGVAGVEGGWQSTACAYPPLHLTLPTCGALATAAAAGTIGVDF